MSLPSLTIRIEALGAEVVACPRNCEDVRQRDPANGVIPRGLYLGEGPDAEGVIVCGMNPGLSLKDQTEYYQKEGASYGAVLGWWNRVFPTNHYFQNTLRFIRALDIKGPILWTNVAKCERCETKPRISFETHPQTFRVCADRFLRREVAECPESWPIVANGKDAFVAVSYLFPGRLVIGIPHPTGAQPNFNRMFSAPAVLRPDIDAMIRVYAEKNPHGALWLGGETGVGSRGPETPAS